MSDSEMNRRESAYQKMFNAWDAGEHAYALELSRELLHDFPDFKIGRIVQGAILYELARYAEAEEILYATVEDLSAESKDHGYIQLGHLFREKGDYESAGKWYRKAIELDPLDAGRHIFLGLVLAKSGNLNVAEEVHRQATQCSKGAIDEAYLNLGLVLRAQERYQEALECFEKALELSADYRQAANARNDVKKALIYLRTGE